VLSIFYVNASYLDLASYAAGRDHMPFQRRLLMVPVLRWAQGNAWLQALAERYGRFVHQAEPMTAAKLVCVLLGLVVINALGLLLWQRARRLGLRTRWLAWALLVVILYASYAARYEQALWYPYDLPHVALFGAATVFVLTDEPWLFALCFGVDAFTRETSVFLIVLALVVRLQERRWRIAAGACAVVWMGAQALARWIYPAGAHQFNAVPLLRMAMPWHWPQIASMVGFMWVPVLLGRRWLVPMQRRALLAASACMVITFFFATWNESRAWAEWSALFAVLAAVELEHGLREGAVAAAPL
jgi:hypothetical protein